MELIENWTLHFSFFLSFYWIILFIWLKSDRLTWVDLGIFLSFFYLIFLNLIIQYWVDWGLSFIKKNNLFYMKLSRSYDLDRGLDRLTRVFFLFFFIEFFFNISWLKIRLHNLLYFVFYKVILVSWSKTWVWLVDPSHEYFYVIFYWFF
jgi:hypothetical protein